MSSPYRARPSRTKGGRIHRRAAWLLVAGMILRGGAGEAQADQGVQPLVNLGEKVLQFDWPMLQIGTGEYVEGPTGVTVIRFAKKVIGAVDVRRGAPGTVNTDYLRLGYERPELDAVVFSGGSWYGLASTTAVATRRKHERIR